jgi:DNA-binding MarR family transcriptional regulator
MVVARRRYTVSSYKYILYMSIYTNRDTLLNQDRIKEIEVETSLVRQSKIRRGERFLRGPIPLKDIATAACLPGQALALFLAVHHQTALTGKPSVTLPARLLAELGISRGSKSRGLKALEQSGLITVAQSKGRAARIQLRKTAQEGRNNVDQTQFRKIQG